jgi:hypothetical protein
MTMIICCFLTMEFQSVTFAKRILLNHIVKLTALVAIRPHRHTSFATVTNVTTTKQVVKLLGIPRKIQPRPFNPA